MQGRTETQVNTEGTAPQVTQVTQLTQETQRRISSQAAQGGGIITGNTERTSSQVKKARHTT